MDSASVSLSLGSLWAFFPMSIEALTARSQGKRAAKARVQEAEEERPVRSLVAARLPRVHQVFGAGTTFAQYLSLTRLRLRTITSEVTFWAIVGLLIVFAVNNGHFAGRVGGVDVWPVTYLMLQAVEGGATLFFYIVATLYAAELIWRERDTHFDGIHDALPMSVTHRLAFQAHRHRAGRGLPARARHAGRHRHADHRGILPLRAPAIFEGAVPGNLSRRLWRSRFSPCSSRPWSRINSSATALSSASSCCSPSCSTSDGKTPSTFPAPRRLTLTPT